MTELAPLARRDQFSLWFECEPVQNSPAVQHLARIGIAPEAISPEAVRWSRRLRAIVAIFRSMTSGKTEALCIVEIDDLGRRLPARFIGNPSGAALMLHPPVAVADYLVLADGLLPALAAVTLGLRPVWAVPGPKALAAFPIIERVHQVGVLARFDDDGANARAIETLADRWHQRGRDVMVIAPSVPGSIADELGRVAE